jgi:hypothetical protein
MRAPADSALLAHALACYTDGNDSYERDEYRSPLTETNGHWLRAIRQRARRENTTRQLSAEWGLPAPLDRCGGSVTSHSRARDACDDSVSREMVGGTTKG